RRTTSLELEQNIKNASKKSLDDVKVINDNYANQSEGRVSLVAVKWRRDGGVDKVCNHSQSTSNSLANPPLLNKMRRISSLLSLLVYTSAVKVDDSVHYFVTFDTAENGLAGGQLLEEENEKALKDDNSVRISTQNNENYICKLPQPTTTLEEDVSAYTGLSPAELIAPFYKEKLCSYRVEPYWTYELCHGRYIVQYHEEKDSRGNILRTHDTEKAKPKSLLLMEEYHENTFKREYALGPEKPAMDMEHIERVEKAIEKMQQQFENKEILKLAGQKKYQGVDTLANNRLIVEDTVNRILSGRECIYGGEGWWRYEFCYGKTVLQYHQEPNGDRTEILLGSFDENVHKAWVEEDKSHRSPKKYNNQVTQVSHIYVKGDICHELNAHRNVEVRLRCKTADHSSLAISLSLAEPNLCQYVLTVESERFCEPLQYADEYGLIALELQDSSSQTAPGPI
ncbi:hypothetical protein GCK32_008692, partial [Trichostrongylus colubriformis]